MTMQVAPVTPSLFAPGGLGIKYLHLFPGGRPGVTDEEVAQAINRALDDIECVAAGIVGEFDD